MKALEQEPTTWSLDDAREDFMYDVYNTLDFLPTNNEANRIIDSFDRVTSGLNQQSCEDCISRQAAIRWVKTECNPYGKPTLDFESGKKIIKYLKRMPSVIPQQKVGRWINAYPDIEPDPMLMYGICSKCGFEQGISDKLNYCSNCGAKMEGEYD